MNYQSILPTILIVTFLSSPTFARKWTDASGNFSVEAEFVEATSVSVILEKPNGERITVPLEKLSQADRLFVRSKNTKAAGPSVKKSPKNSKVNPSIIIEEIHFRPILSGTPNDLDKIPPPHGDYRLYLNCVAIPNGIKPLKLLESNRQLIIAPRPLIPAIREERSDNATWSGHSPFSLTAKELELFLQISIIEMAVFDPFDVVTSISQDGIEITSFKITLNKDLFKDAEKDRKVQFLVRSPLVDVPIRQDSKLSISFSRTPDSKNGTTEAFLWGLGSSHLEFRDKRSSPENLQTAFTVVAEELSK